MLGHYGWIMACGDIDHPDVGKTGGRIYVHKRDLAKGVSLVQGDAVSFFLYVDEQGLGAECCSLAQGAVAGRYAEGQLKPSRSNFADPNLPPSFLVDASLSSKWNTRAQEFVPAADTIAPSSFNVEATVFIPSPVSMMSSDAHEFVPGSGYSDMLALAPNVLAFNPAFLSDDESDDEDSVASNDDFSGNEADKESTESDNESAVSIQSTIKSSDLEGKAWKRDKDVAWSPRLDAVVMHAPLKPAGASSDEDSTSIGGASDSEEEDRLHFAMSAPPGLSLSPGWRPPPGLSMPVRAA
jgi:hypothetical protein